MSNMKLGIVITATNRAGKALDNVERQIDTLSQRSQRVGSAMIGMGAKTMATGVAMGYALSKPIKSAMAFESAMADVKKVVNFDSKSDFKKFSSEIVGLSKTIPIAASGLAQIAASAGQLGIAKDKIIPFTKTVAKMSTAFDMMPSVAGDSIAKLMNVYGLGIAEAGKLGDAINHLSDNTAAKASDIVNVLGRIGGNANLFGLTAVQTAALADGFLAMGLPAEKAGTAINSLLTKLGTADKGGKKFQAALRKIGLSGKQVKKMIGKDANGAILSFLQSVKRLPKNQQMGILVDIMGREFADEIATVIGGLDKYEQALRLTANEQEYLGSMEREFQNRAATTANKFRILGNGISAVAINLGSLFLPAIQKIVTKMTSVTEQIGKWAEENPKLAKTIGEAGAAIAAFLVVAGGIGVVGGVFVKGIGMMLKPVSSGVGLLGKLTRATGRQCDKLGCIPTSAGKAGESIKSLNKTVRSTRSLWAKGLVLGVSIAGVALVLSELNRISKAAKQRIDDKRTITPTKANIPKMKAKQDRLEKEIKLSKGEDGFWSQLGHTLIVGENSKAKTAQLEKLRKRSQLQQHRAETGWKAPTVTAPVLGPEKIAQAQRYAAKMRAFHAPAPQQRPIYQPTGYTATKQDTVKPALESLKSQYGALQQTVQTIAARPEQHTYHINVTVNNASSNEAVGQAVADAVSRQQFHKQQRTMHDL